MSLRHQGRRLLQHSHPGVRLLQQGPEVPAIRPLLRLLQALRLQALPQGADQPGHQLARPQQHLRQRPGDLAPPPHPPRRPAQGQRQSGEWTRRLAARGQQGLRLYEGARAVLLDGRCMRFGHLFWGVLQFWSGFKKT